MPGSGELLVGNFGDGRINAYHFNQLSTLLVAQLDGPVLTTAHTPLVIDGLWAFVFGPAASAGEAPELYFQRRPGRRSCGWRKRS